MGAKNISKPNQDKNNRKLKQRATTENQQETITHKKTRNQEKEQH
jgi:hypothetical protein